eukprot:TRINITY_DN63741_c0_g1_i1.p1 TRINITY_DN63741_c0_g1~~TRINITY_DN63741_c0_g1_i1.p1  ORF type:complete len:272 (+),score=42.93 TRINITY_DN63741_c0_g1_i1:98-913(+)
MEILPAVDRGLASSNGSTDIPPASVSEVSGVSAAPMSTDASSSSELHIRQISLHGKCARHLRIVCLSDTHSMHRTLPTSLIPQGDLLLHCGDFTKKGTRREVADFSSFLGELPHPVKIVISGNHDVGPFCEFDPRLADTLLPGVVYLRNSLVEVEGLRIYGSPWESRGNPAVPADVDILMTHGPPSGILDAGRGCPYLRKDIVETRPRLHVFGHIHEASGFLMSGDGEEDVVSTTFVNAAMANDGMVSKMLDKPITVIDMLPALSDETKAA